LGRWVANKTLQQTSLSGPRFALALAPAPESTMWRETITAVSSNVRFGPPGSERALRDAEAALQVTFPESLRGLLLEADGVEGEYGLGLIWSGARIREDNIRFRHDSGFVELYMPFQPLLFFADAEMVTSSPL
jgi:hypothetical protein